jgi:hypothetical protein
VACSAGGQAAAEPSSPRGYQVPVPATHVSALRCPRAADLRLDGRRIGRATRHPQPGHVPDATVTPGDESGVPHRAVPQSSPSSRAAGGSCQVKVSRGRGRCWAGRGAGAITADASSLNRMTGLVEVCAGTGAAVCDVFALVIWSPWFRCGPCPVWSGTGTAAEVYLDSSLPPEEISSGPLLQVRSCSLLISEAGRRSEALLADGRRPWRCRRLRRGGLGDARARTAVATLTLAVYGFRVGRQRLRPPPDSLLLVEESGARSAQRARCDPVGERTSSRVLPRFLGAGGSKLANRAVRK